MYRNVQEDEDDQDEDKDSIWMSFLRDSSIHGVKYLGQPNRPILDRLFWMAVLLGSIVASAYFILLVFQKYDNSPVIVSFHSHQTPIYDVPFPSITVCSVNRFKKSFVLKKFEEMKSDDPVTVDKAKKILRALDHVCSVSQSFSTYFNYSINETTINSCQRFNIGCSNNGSDGIRPHGEDSEVQSELLAALAAFYDCSEIVKLCLWNGQKLNCRQQFSPTMTEMGLCCSFNKMPAKYFTRNLNTSTPGYHNGYEEPGSAPFWKETFDLDELLVGNMEDKRKQKQYQKFMKFQPKAGQGSGFSFVLNPAVDEYFCSAHDSYGFRIHLHSPIEHPHVQEYGIAIPPNSEVFVNVEPDLTKSDPAIRDMDKNRRNCYFSKKDLELPSYNFYTTTNCMDQCVVENVARVCRCVRLGFSDHVSDPDLVNITYCEGSSFKCADMAIKNMTKTGMIEDVCKDCKPSCNRLDYKTQVSSFPLLERIRITVKEDPDDQDSEDIEVDIDKNASIVHIYYGSENVQTKIRKKLYGFNDFVAHVGGILGLFLGMSFLSLLEPINLIFQLLQKEKSRKQRSQKNTVRPLDHNGKGRERINFNPKSMTPYYQSTNEDGMLW